MLPTLTKVPVFASAPFLCHQLNKSLILSRDQSPLSCSHLCIVARTAILEASSFQLFGAQRGGYALLQMLATCCTAVWWGVWEVVPLRSSSFFLAPVLSRCSRRALLLCLLSVAQRSSLTSLSHMLYSGWISSDKRTCFILVPWPEWFTQIIWWRLEGMIK